MIEDHLRVAAAASRLARRLPQSVMVLFAAAVERHGVPPGTDPRLLLQSVPTPEFREAAAEFLSILAALSTVPDRSAVSLALTTAAACERERLDGEAVEIVWTGPDSAATRFRQTEQAILEVIDSAKQRLTIVSYAVYRIPRIRSALIAAANRGVAIHLVVETPNRLDGKGEYDCILALGGNVAAACSVYYWPHENRPADDNGKTGILHVKCAVADGTRMFLSSANFTEYAFTINMELGVLITGGRTPAEVEGHFGRLIDAGSLLPV